MIPPQQTGSHNGQQRAQVQQTGSRNGQQRAQVQQTGSRNGQQRAQVKHAAGGTDGAKQHFVGSDKDMVSYCDVAGVTHKEDSLNTVLKVQFRKKAVLLNRAGMDQEFGVKLCKPPMASTLHGRARFTLCDQSDPPDHANAASSAHRIPDDYRQRMSQHFC